MRTVQGLPFATGKAPLGQRNAFSSDRFTRVFLAVKIAGLTTEAVMDTGGAYLIIDPALADAIGLRHDTAIHGECIAIRGCACSGAVHRLPVTVIAAAGEALTFEATAFVPSLAPGEAWVLPSFLGWQGCLERIRFAIDPGEEVIYFGAVE
jgi:hypothetical protein